MDAGYAHDLDYQLGLSLTQAVGCHSAYTWFCLDFSAGQFVRMLACFSLFFLFIILYFYGHPKFFRFKGFNISNVLETFPQL